MARIFTTPDMEATAKAFLHDITLAAGLHSDNKRSQRFYYLSDNNYIQHATTICDELVNRDFNNIDRAINYISSYRFYAPLTGSKQSAKRLKAEGVAKSIVYMAECLSIYWDDTIRTPYEIDEFKKTLLGAAVYKYGRYISAIKDPKTKAAKSSKAGASTTASNGTTANQPKSGYKQSGPQSGNARDLIGNPGEKVIADGAFIYKIIGDSSSSKNIPNVFVNPLSASGAAGSTNKVSFSSGNGYSDCTCFFDDPNDAADFLDKIIKNNRVPANVSNPRVVKMKADANGYFLVGTEFGRCAISAKKLNEALTEEANCSNERPFSWEKATESYSKEELEELHTWMRRD